DLRLADAVGVPGGAARRGRRRRIDLPSPQPRGQIGTRCEVLPQQPDPLCLVLVSCLDRHRANRECKRLFENRQVRASRLVMVVIMARWTMASWWSGLVSWSRAQRRCLLIHPELLSTTQMRGRT